jgi:hypothetical protein
MRLAVWTTCHDSLGNNERIITRIPPTNRSDIFDGTTKALINTNQEVAPYFSDENIKILTFKNTPYRKSIANSPLGRRMWEARTIINWPWPGEWELPLG